HPEGAECPRNSPSARPLAQQSGSGLRPEQQRPTRSPPLPRRGIAVPSCLCILTPAPVSATSARPALPLASVQNRHRRNTLLDVSRATKVGRFGARLPEC